MKKVMIITRILTGGGAERVAASLASYLKDRYDVLLVVIDGSRRTYETKAKVEFLNLSVFDKGNGINRAKWFLSVYKKIKNIREKYNPDCVISFLTEPELMNALTKGQGKSITSIRNVRSSVVKNKAKKMRDKWVFSRMDGIVSLSYNAKMDLVNNYGVSANKIKVIYNICETERITDRIKHGIISNDELEWINNEKTLITLGRLTEQKAQWHMIRAFKNVVMRIPDAKLVILGEGDKKAYLQDLISNLNLSSSICLMGYKENPYVYLANSAGFVFSSVYEGLGNSIVEAMACGLPVISTDCNAGPRELLAPNTDFNKSADKMEMEEYGILTPVCDGREYSANDPLTYEETQLANAMLLILENKSVANDYRKKSLERGLQFEKEKIIEQWCDEIEK